MDSYMDLLDLLSQIFIYLFTVTVSQVLAAVQHKYFCCFSYTELNVLPFICLILFMCIYAKTVFQ